MLKNLLKRIRRSEKGQGLVEYALIIAFIGILLVNFLGSLGDKLNDNFRDVVVGVNSSDIKELEDFINTEKDWIIQNQDTDLGVIYMNNIGGISDVNPYFASLAAQGLLVGDVREKDMVSVKSYLDWHTDMFIQTDGELGDYKVIDGVVVRSSDPDSIDSYIAVYISLLVDYLEQGGEFDNAKFNQVVDIAINKFDSLTSLGMIVVSHDYPVIYLMDNTEVVSAYEDLLTYTNDESLKARIRPRLEAIKSGLTGMLWNEEDSHYEVGMHANGHLINYVDETRLYPEAISQVHNLAYDVDLQGYEHSLEQYRKFNEKIDWVNITGLDPNGFFWSELFYIAANANDVERSKQYLESYKRLVGESRAYPFYTATAGWAIKGADRLITIYR